MSSRFLLSHLFLLIAACSLIAIHPTQAAINGLVKGSSASVYYATANGDRFAFPNQKTFASWYQNFSQVRTISDQELAQLSLRGNVTYRPGVRLVKVTTDPKVYAVSRGGALRWVQTEAIARSLYGSNWATAVDDVPDAFFTNYHVTEPITQVSDYSPTAERDQTSSIEIDKGLATSPPPIASRPGVLRTVRVNSAEALRDATNQAQPGDLILIAPGSYSFSRQWWVETKGTATHPIYIVADGARNSVKLTSTDEAALNVGGGAAYLVFEGLEASHTANDVFHVQDGAHNITLRNLYLHDAGFDGDVLKINQAKEITVEGCELARPGRRPAGNEAYWQEALDLVDVDDAVIRRNFIHDVGNMAGYVKGGSKRVFIEENVIENQRTGADGNPIWGIGGSTDSELLDGEAYEAINTVFRNNVIAHTAYGGLALMDAQNSIVEHNLFLNVNAVAIQSRAGNAPRASTDGVSIQNNLFVDTTGRMSTVCEHLNNGLSGVSASDNLYWNNNQAVPTTGGCGFTPSRESGARTQDPHLSDIHPTTYEQAMQMLIFP